MMELKDTVEMMNSSDYKERFKAEYYQTKIRYEKLHSMLIKNEAGVLDFKPTCPVAKLVEQKWCYYRDCRMDYENSKCLFK